MLTPALREAIEQLYRVFARYPRQREVHGCACCVTNVDQARLHRVPLRELEADDLRRYATKAMSTWGDDRDFRHFLPRILDLISNPYDDLGANEQIVLGKLSYGGWTRWPRAEQDALMQWMHAWWQDVLTGDSHEVWRAPDVLSSVLVTGHPLAPLLETFDVELTRSSTARAALLAFVEALSYERTLDPWTSHERSDEITRWLVARTRTVERAIEEAHETDRDRHRYALEAFAMRAHAL